MDIFELFKPIRNKIRGLNLQASLDELYLLKSRGQILPEVGEFLYINLILYADAPSINSKHKDSFEKVLNLCNALNGKIAELKIETEVWRWLHTLALSQLKAKYNGYKNSVYRYYYIFSEESISKHIENVIGIPYKDYFICALWLHAVFVKKFASPKAYFIGKNNGSVIFSKENMLKTLDLLSLSLYDLRIQLKQVTKFDEDLFILHGYPHLLKPLLEKDGNLYCMYPDHLQAQFLSGIYYIASVGDKKNKLANAFGKSFEQYLGMVLKKNNTNDLFQIIEEIEFSYKSNKLKTSDWIVKSSDAITFIECKTKRLRLPSKTMLSSAESLSVDIDFMAAAVTQLYKVYDHYKNDRIPGLKYDSKMKFIPMVVTLEEWFAGGPDIKEKLTESVKTALIKADIPLQVLDEYNFRTYSINAFEWDVQIMFQLDFLQYLEKLSNGEINENFQKEFPYIEYYEEEFEKTFMDAARAV
ncbi:MAG: hypothetical protein V4541_00650 [Bacteroidota bacterium]